MSMNLDLTISGLCVIVFKSQEERPVHPEAVEVICIGDHHGIHRPRLSYRPEDAVTSAELEPSLSIDPQGRRFASLDVTGQVITLDVGRNSRSQFSVKWSPTASTVPSNEDAWMNWVPSVQDLGVQRIRLGAAGELPHGVAARLILPPGDIEARNVIRNPENRDEFLQWNFPAVPGLTRALANEIVFHGVGIEVVDFRWNDGSRLFAEGSGTLEMGLSNDLLIVNPEFRTTSPILEHLLHLDHLADPPGNIRVPELLALQQTGRPICNQLYYIDNGTT
jgi:hypothetical protein